MTVLDQTHSRRRFLQLTGAVGATAALGGVLQAFKGGADLPAADATIGGSSFHEFLTP